VALGVADGVHAWREKGIDAGLFSRALCAAAASAHTTGGGVAGGGRGVPLRLLQSAFQRVRAEGVQGSATLCMVVVDTTTGRLSSANVGDSGYLLMSPARGAAGGSGGGGGNPGSAAWQPGGVRYRSPHQEHEFGRPYQLGHHGASDAPEDAMLHEARLAHGDVLVLGTDGLWDNLHDSEIAAAVAAAVRARAPPSAVAAAVVQLAHERSVGRGSTPYSVAATEAFDLVFSGGKRDDIAVLVVEVSAARNHGG
jgi:protein phosphatase PTC7